jgi:indolepyruvate ferredoxin oxidoreductase
MAAHLEGKGVGIIDMAGLAQKGGAVFSHIRFAERPEHIHAIRVSAGGADLVLGGDIVVAGNKKVLSAMRPDRTKIVVNLAEILPGEFARNPSYALPSERLRRAIADAAHDSFFLDASSLASGLFGSSLGANLLLLGYAYQIGGLPLSAAAIEKAIELNGEAVAMNIAAFRFGRWAAVDAAAVEALVTPAVDEKESLSQSFEELVARRATFLTAYQDEAYAARYRRWVEKVRAAEATKAPRQCGLAEAVARYLFKLMAYKDEYEVARLYADAAFLAEVNSTFEGKDLKLRFHLAPPLLARRDKTTGLPRKMTFGPWLMGAFRLLAPLKVLRGTRFDPFGYTRERRTERQLIADYEVLLDRLIADLKPENHAIAVSLAGIPDKIRGFGHVKMRHLAAAKAEEAALLERFGTGEPAVLKAAE